jgi:hypothetical protein
MVAFGQPVDVFGMQAAHDDVIHADVHGAVVVPAECVTKIPAAVDLISRREKVILDICRDPEFSVAKLRDAIRRAGEIHSRSLRSDRTTPSPPRKRGSTAMDARFRGHDDELSRHGRYLL